ncbi:hypothetical protein GS966_28465 [Rhodococcus hoagii]|nr:hypothetical protein [Prescottella equi]
MRLPDRDIRAGGTVPLARHAYINNVDALPMTIGMNSRTTTTARSCGRSGGFIMMSPDGRLHVTSDELAEFVSLTAVQPIAKHLWLLNTATGETRVERSDDDPSAVPDGWVLLMTGPSPPGLSSGVEIFRGR